MQNKEKKTASTKAFLALFIFFRPNNFRILIQILFIALCFIQQTAYTIWTKLWCIWYWSSCCRGPVTQVFIFFIVVGSYFYTTFVSFTIDFYYLCVAIFNLLFFFSTLNDDLFIDSSTPSLFIQKHHLNEKFYKMYEKIVLVSGCHYVSFWTV